MSKAEHIFKGADFSEDTDLKDRLRAQLFHNSGPASSAQSDHNNRKLSEPNRFSRRILSFEELDMVNAAGNSAQILNNLSEKEDRKSKSLLDQDAQNQWKDPFSGIDGKPPKI